MQSQLEYEDAQARYGQAVAHASAEARAAFITRTYLHLFGAIVAFLCSEQANYLTGAQIHVDGGAYATWPNGPFMETGMAIKNVPGPAAGWTKVRDLPAPAASSFRDLWNAARR